MRKLVENLRKDVVRFIEQRDDLLMIVSCSGNDAAIFLQILRDIEQSSAKDIFLLFADDFVLDSPFVSVTVERLREQHNAVCEALAEKNQPPLAPLPPGLFDESQPPQLRLFQAIGFARSLLPAKGGHRLVWAMCPTKISDRQGYLRLVSSFVPREGVKPWMAGVRLIFRDEPGTAEYFPELAGAPRVRFMSPDLGPAAMESSLQADVEDQGIPEEERMQSLLSLALLDYAHSRTEQALAKYNVLLAFYQKTGNPTMQAFVINAFGDVFHRAGDLERALYWYECAVPPAATAKDPLILSSVTKNLADVSYKLGKYPDAEQYYDGLDKLSGVTLDPGTKIRALEGRGLSQEQQAKHEAAIESLETAALLSRKMGIPNLLSESLTHLTRLYNKAGQGEKAASAEAELKTVELQEVSA
jgi:tetratricopeptide (TPR) repeat protein